MTTTMRVTPGEQRPVSRTKRMFPWKSAAALAVLAGVGVALYVGGVLPENLKDARNLLRKGETAVANGVEGPPPAAPPPSGSWDGLVAVNDREQKAIGFNFDQVKAQTEPILLELTGRTEYDKDMIRKVRPRFDTKVERVFASIGKKIKTGDPLVELYSTDLAKAKTDYQTKFVQWQHDLNLYNLRQELVKTGAISQQLWVDTQNDEQKSRLDFNIAMDNLKVFYEVPQEEIDPLLEGIGSKAVDPRKFGSITEKAKMTLRAKSEGIVVTREVVPGNYYESTDTLMQIAPLDHLWVWVNVYELDQTKVALGQTMIIQFPFLPQRIVGKVNYVASEVSKDTRAVQVRASIPNPDASLKSDMLVKSMLEIPPVPGQTVIPRLAMVAISGGEYAFVRVARPEASHSDKAPQVDKFERRMIDVAQENTDFVVVGPYRLDGDGTHHGLKAGEVVVTNGSLILSQLYEDQRVTVTGMPGR